MFVIADNFVFQNPAQRKLAERYQQFNHRTIFRWTVSQLFLAVHQQTITFFARQLFIRQKSKNKTIGQLCSFSSLFIGRQQLWRQENNFSCDSSEGVAMPQLFFSTASHSRQIFFSTTFLIGQLFKSTTINFLGTGVQFFLCLSSLDNFS